MINVHTGSIMSCIIWQIFSCNNNKRIIIFILVVIVKSNALMKIHSMYSVGKYTVSKKLYSLSGCGLLIAAWYKHSQYDDEYNEQSDHHSSNNTTHYQLEFHILFLQQNSLCVCVCVRACVRACVRVCVCVTVCI